MAQDALLEVRGLRKDFVSKGNKGTKTVHALSGIDFSVHAGETFGLVGESGDMLPDQPDGGAGCFRREGFIQPLEVGAQENAQGYSDDFPGSFRLT